MDKQVRVILIAVLGIAALLVLYRVLFHNGNAGDAATSAAGTEEISDGEKVQIASEVRNALVNKRSSTNGAVCANFIAIGDANVVDANFQGTNGNAVVEVILKPIRRPTIMEGPYTLEECYGEPSGGFQVGQNIAARYILPIMRFQSGWQLVTPMNLSSWSGRIVTDNTPSPPPASDYSYGPPASNDTVALPETDTATDNVMTMPDRAADAMINSVDSRR